MFLLNLFKVFQMKRKIRRKQLFRYHIFILFILFISKELNSPEDDFTFFFNYLIIDVIVNDKNFIFLWFVDLLIYGKLGRYLQEKK